MHRSHSLTMDSVIETPLKKLHTEPGSLGPHVPDVDDASSDGIHTDYEGLDTQALPQYHHVSQLPSSYVTQPTQLLNPLQRPSPPSEPPTVHVAASSSPASARQQSPMAPRQVPKPAERLASLSSSLAPRGTMYRPPPGVQKPPPGMQKPTPPKQVVDLDSDHEGPMKYRGAALDEDKDQTRDIKPSVIKTRKPLSHANGSVRASEQSRNGSATQAGRFDQFRHTSSNDNSKGGFSFSSLINTYNKSDSIVHAAPGAKRQADEMASAYGNSSRPAKMLRQNQPAKAKPVEKEITLDDIEDFQMRQKVEKVLGVLPDVKILVIKQMIVQCKGNEDDAMDRLLAGSQPKSMDLANSDRDDDVDELALVSPTQRAAPAMKQQLKAPVKAMHQKYGILSQAKAKPQNAPKPAVSSPQVPETPPAKPKRKLMRGRKFQDDPDSSPPAKVPKTSRAATPLTVDSDSGVASEPESDHSYEGDLLKFFNTCAIGDLCDLASINEDVAQLVLAKRPFKTLNQVRKITDDSAEKAAKPTKSKRKTTKRPIGEKIMDVSERMWTGYQAVDRLVSRCNDHGKRVADKMKDWGVDVFGVTKSGELELVSLSPGSGQTASTMRDSGIGTPTDTDVDESPNGKTKTLNGKKNATLFAQPTIMPTSVTLKDYQIVGMNWLTLLYKENLSCILADDMGLGKTCQVISFLAHLLEKNIRGPHLVVVPSSTLENWLREFHTFCPAMRVSPYYGSEKDRQQMQETLQDDMPEVLVTTYTIAKKKADRKYLNSIRPNVVVYDEGHQLKNSKSQAYDELMRIKSKFRLLLTGTPLQNNLSELASLLGFILPDVFEEHREDLDCIFSHRAKTTDETHTALLSAQRIERARSMMAPFILRRKKHQVLKHLPEKTRRVVHCDLTESQKAIYDAEMERWRKVRKDREAGIKPNSKGQDDNNNNNPMMRLRQTAIHSLLRRHRYDQTKLRKMAKTLLRDEPDLDPNTVEQLVYEDLEILHDFDIHRECLARVSLNKFALADEPWMDSGKVAALVPLLREYQANGDRVLIFSQFVQVMDILEEVLETAAVRFSRLDGNTRVEERQELLDQFHRDPSVTAFLLSTRAGGAGINLACANKVVVFDSSFNPQDDIQAENRAHRVGQTRPVEVVRLVTRGTIEEQIHALGESKIALDERVAGEGEGEADAKVAKAAEKKGMAQVEKMMEEKEKETNEAEPTEKE